MKDNQNSNIEPKSIPLTPEIQSSEKSMTPLLNISHTPGIFNKIIKIKECHKIISIFHQIQK